MDFHHSYYFLYGFSDRWRTDIVSEVTFYYYKGLAGSLGPRIGVDRAMAQLRTARDTVFHGSLLARRNLARLKLRSAGFSIHWLDSV